ncbi:hypothetical protein DRO69_10095 [Candidatus Bathyarchaeota archaeon]|nr:MAG: hypothetical protein DRO69_10095 [Candidatus Bathyarchaeota archaeon]
MEEKERVKTLEQRLRRGGILSLTLGSISIADGIAVLYSLPPVSATLIIAGMTAISGGIMSLSLAHNLAKGESWVIKSFKRSPTGFAGWFIKPRNFIVVLILAFLFGLLVFGPLLLQIFKALSLL